MKTVLFALVTLSVLAAVAAPGSAAEFDTKTFWEQQRSLH